MKKYPRRKDVRCRYCLTEFRVYGNQDAANSKWNQKIKGRIVWCPACKIHRTCSDL